MQSQESLKQGEERSVMETKRGQDGKTSEAEMGVLDQGCEEGSSEG